MPLPYVGRKHVLAAIREYDQLGRGRFLAKYGYERSPLYVLVHDGRRYDAKAILGAAAGYSRDDRVPLGNDEFSGGAQTVAAAARLNFELLPAAVFDANASGCALWTAALDRLDVYLEEETGRGHPVHSPGELPQPKKHRPLLLLYVFAAARRGHGPSFPFVEYDREVGPAIMTLTTATSEDTRAPFWALSRRDSKANQDWRYWDIMAATAIPQAGHAPPRSWFNDVNQAVTAVVRADYWEELQKPGVAALLYARIVRTYFTDDETAEVLRRNDSLDIADSAERGQIRPDTPRPDSDGDHPARDPEVVGLDGVGPVVGVPFAPADETPASAPRQVPFIDLEKIDRGTGAHNRTLNALEAWLRSRGIQVRLPAQGEPKYDALWKRGGATFVAEVKSITRENEQIQLRLGLGQVLHYRYAIERRGDTARAVLVLESPPADDDWLLLCDQLGVILAWPGEFERILAEG